MKVYDTAESSSISQIETECTVTLSCSFTTGELRESCELPEEMEHIDLSQPENLSGKTNYSRLYSYQTIVVYPVAESDTSTNLWHSSLSVSLKHPIFITVSTY